MSKASRPDLIGNSTVGDLNVLYSRVLRAAGVTPDRIPTLYLSVSEIADPHQPDLLKPITPYARWDHQTKVSTPLYRS